MADSQPKADSQVICPKCEKPGVIRERVEEDWQITIVYRCPDCGYERRKTI